MTRLVDISGSKYGDLLVVERVPRQLGDTHTKWQCQCDCGNTTVATYINLKSGNTTSCGCKRRPHGEANSPTHGCWSSMMRRCVWKSDSKYNQVVPVADEWRDFKTFFKDMGERPSLGHSLDRIDNSKGYEPGNVRWATSVEQNSNRRDNVWIETRGERRTIAGWARYFKVTPRAVREYYRRHGTLDTYRLTSAQEKVSGCD